jgi:uncharacterized protein (UPF0333 family)
VAAHFEGRGQVNKRFAASRLAIVVVVVVVAIIVIARYRVRRS